MDKIKIKLNDDPKLFGFSTRFKNLNKMMLQYSAAPQCSLAPHHPPVRFVLPKIISCTSLSSNLTRRGALSTALISTTLGTLIFTISPPSKSAITEFLEIPNSGGVKALDLRLGAGEVPSDGDQVIFLSHLHYMCVSV